jgi:hypothetical protein
LRIQEAATILILLIDEPVAATNMKSESLPEFLVDKLEKVLQS